MLSHNFNSLNIRDWTLFTFHDVSNLLPYSLSDATSKNRFFLFRFTLVLTMLVPLCSLCSHKACGAIQCTYYTLYISNESEITARRKKKTNYTDTHIIWSSPLPRAVKRNRRNEKLDETKIKKLYRTTFVVYLHITSELRTPHRWRLNGKQA